MYDNADRNHIDQKTQYHLPDIGPFRPERSGAKCCQESLGLVAKEFSFFLYGGKLTDATR